VLDQKLPQALVTGLIRRHQRREIVLLARVRIGAVLEEKLGDLITRLGVARRGSAVQGHHLHLVPRG